MKIAISPKKTESHERMIKNRERDRAGKLAALQPAVLFCLYST